MPRRFDLQFLFKTLTHSLKKKWKQIKEFENKTSVFFSQKGNLHLCCSLDMESSKPDMAEKTAKMAKKEKATKVSHHQD